MSDRTFEAYWVERDASGTVHGGIRSLTVDDLPPGDVLIQSQWSSLNYKDALAATGHPGVARRLPHIPGIDVAGTVAALDAEPQGGDPTLQVGTEVLVTGYELGAGQWGGWSQFVRVPREWVIKLPPTMSPHDAMALGTAGFTAAQCVDALQHHGIVPGSGPIVVTGATGGVGSIAILLLAKLGYEIVAVSGKTDWYERLRGWGVSEILSREAIIDGSRKPLLPGRWAGAVDTVGGETLATIIRQTQDHGCVTACGLVGGTEMPLSVYPFILRGVTLAGITSSGCPRDKRIELWNRLATDWQLDQLAAITHDVPLAEIGGWVPQILAGEVAGRTVVQHR